MKIVYWWWKLIDNPSWLAINVDRWFKSIDNPSKLTVQLDWSYKLFDDWSRLTIQANWQSKFINDPDWLRIQGNEQFWKWLELMLNPDPLGSKNITIHYPGAIFGTFIINQFTWSLFWQFWYLIVHWFKFKKLAILLPGAFFGTF